MCIRDRRGTDVRQSCIVLKANAEPCPAFGGPPCQARVAPCVWKAGRIRTMSETYAALVSEEERLLSEYLRKIEHCVGLLTPAEVWWRPNARCNSVGNLLLHLSGNLSQWVLAGLGGAEYERRRREEFAAETGEH